MPVTLSTAREWVKPCPELFASMTASELIRRTPMATERVRLGPPSPTPMTAIRVTGVQVVARVTWKLDQFPDSLHR